MRNTSKPRLTDVAKCMFERPGISSVAMLSTVISLPVSIHLGAVSLNGASVSGMAMAHESRDIGRHHDISISSVRSKRI